MNAVVKWTVEMLIVNAIWIGVFAGLAKMTGSMESAVQWVIGIGVTAVAIIVVGYFNNHSPATRQSPADELYERRLRDQHRY